MSTIRELLRKKAVKGDVGIEIEVEGNGLKAVDDAVWKSVDDGSLRGVYPDSRCEYVLQKPVQIKSVRTALESLLKELEGATFKFSYRTSVHVHVNIQELEYDALLAMMYTYYLLEEPLMTYCGKTRKGNNFCLRLADAEGVLDYVLGMFQNGYYELEHLRKDMIRYAAMNIEAVQKYGSLEFRGMEGNLNVDRIDTWCKALVAIRSFAVDCGDPKKVYDRFQQLGPMDFLDEVLGEVAPHFIYARASRDIETSFSISIDLPFAYKKFEAPKFEPEKELWRYKEGEIVDYNTAIKIIANGGYCVAVGPQQYKVKRRSHAPNKVPEQIANWIAQPLINQQPQF